MLQELLKEIPDRRYNDDYIVGRFNQLEATTKLTPAELAEVIRQIARLRSPELLARISKNLQNREFKELDKDQVEKIFATHAPLGDH